MGTLKRKWVYFSLLIFISVPFSSNALTLDSYIASYLANSEVVERARLDLKLAEEDLKISRDLYQTTFSLTPNQDHLDQDFSPSGIKLYERNTKLDGELSQGLPFGAGLRLSVSENIEDSNNVVGRIDSTLTLAYSQSLWKDAFGRLSTLKIKKAESSVAQARLNWQDVQLKQCMSGAKLFFETYIEQEKEKIFSEQEAEALKEKNSVGRDYKKRLVKKIDWLSAQADYLDLKSKREDAVRKLENKRSELLTKSEIETVTSLDDPKDKMEKALSTDNFDKTKSLLLKSLDYKVLSKKNASDIAAEEAKSDLSFSIAAGSRQGQALVSSSLEDFKDEFINLSLKWEWPVFNRTNKANRMKAQFEQQKAELSRKSELKTLKESWVQFFNDYRVNKARLKTSLEKQSLFKKQVKEALRLLRVGKFEVDQYLDFRDKYLREKLEGLDLSLSIWQARLQLAEINSEKLEFCGVSK